jgi:hypothetical protein
MLISRLGIEVANDRRGSIWWFATIAALALTINGFIPEWGDWAK